MTVALRAHHLLCLLTYVGRGYSDAFVANMDRIAARLNAGEPIEIVTGPDEICVVLCGKQEDHCEGSSAFARDAKAAADLAVISQGERPALDREWVARLRAAFRAGAIRSACTACPWESLCTEIARLGFPGVRLHPELSEFSQTG